MRDILHCDMNNCYASIEMKLNPKLRGKALVVSGSVDERRGIVLAKSEKAKKLGIKTGETIWEAKLKCPDLITVPPQYDQYLKHSLMAREIYYSYTNQVEPFGLDEAWLDVTYSKKLFGNPDEIAEDIRKRMKKELGISVSIGVSFNKIFAKLGSDMKKPDAITYIPSERFKKIVWPLDISAILGIGSATRKKLNKINIYTLGDLANTELTAIEKLLGKNGKKLWLYANGQDQSQVADMGFRPEIKSVGNSSTCTEDLLNGEEVYHIFQVLALKVCERLIQYGYQAYGLEIHIRDYEFNSVSYQKKYSYPAYSSIILCERAMDLFKNYKDFRPIRALAIRAIYLVDIDRTQLDFFALEDGIIKKSNLDQAIYKIRKKHGKDSITFASLKENVKLPTELHDIYTLPNSMR